MKINYTLILLFIASLLNAQSILPKYSKVRISLENQSLEPLAKIGLDVAHGFYAPERFFIGDFTGYELQQIEAAGYAVQVIIEDVGKFYEEQNEIRLGSRSPEDCGINDPTSIYTTPENFFLGDMGGFFTYAQMEQILDDMQAQFPDLISRKAPIGNFRSWENRPIYWLRISDNPDKDENEPEVLYTAVHHAREPNGLSQLIFFMWYLLENYESDSEIKYLVDHSELYFVPCINPDGYIYNETIKPNGGGLWRKNRRNNGNGTFGVDLNRNYGYEWGEGYNGSSSNPSSSTYRGDVPFSEPETQAIRFLCENHEFQVALNYHTYGNYLIYPWGFNGETTGDPAFTLMSQVLTQQNGYEYGTVMETLNYIANGDSDDWMYGDVASKNAILAMTPEVGGSFWPRRDQIIGNCQATMKMNLTLANLVHNHSELKEEGKTILSERKGAIKYHLQRYGLGEDPFRVSLFPVSENIKSVGNRNNYRLDFGEAITSQIDYELKSDITDGEEVLFILRLDNDAYVKDFLLRKWYYKGEPTFTDQATKLDAWNTNFSEWGISTQTFYSAPSSITDSPGRDYQNEDRNAITLKNEIIIPEGEKILLTFWAKWNIEINLDFAQLQISVNDGNFFPVCGRYTGIGTAFQDEGEAIYHGIQEDWVQEVIELNDYVSTDDRIRLRFLVDSDRRKTRDGFYFDDLALHAFNAKEDSTLIIDLNEGFVQQNYPNPVRYQTTIQGDLQGRDFDEASIIVFNTLGQEVTSTFLERGTTTYSVDFDTRNWAVGLYMYFLVLDGQMISGKKMLVTR